MSFNQFQFRKTILRSGMWLNKIEFSARSKLDVPKIKFLLKIHEKSIR